jgi:Zn-dependent protease with chaperone function
MLELAREWLVHGLIAAAVCEALLRVWPLEDPDQRLRLRLLGLLLPLAATPAFLLLVPARLEPAFRESRVLLDTGRYPELALAGVTLADGLTLALALAGLLLLCRDLLPLAQEPLSRRPRFVGAPPPPALSAEVGELALRLRLAAAPPVVLIESPQPALLCSGLLRPRLLVSRGSLELLDPAELRAGLAHELAHVARRDPLLGWLVAALRMALAFNPASQLLARAAVRDVEARADDRAIAAGGDRLALASGLLKVFRHSPSRALPFPARPVPLLDGASGLLRNLKGRALEARCRRLLEGRAPRRLRFEGLHLALVGSGLAALLYHVV